MMYEEFKRGLYRNVLGHMGETDARVFLFECRTMYTDEESVCMINAINLASRGVKDVMVLDDILCLAWENDTVVRLKYWNVRLLFERYLEEGWLSVLPEIITRMEEGANGKAKPKWRMSYERCRRRHILRPLNYYRNRDELENCIYRRFGDMALVLYDLVFETGEECSTMKIYREMAEEWGVKDDVLLNNALVNTRDRMPPRLFHGDDLRFDYSQKDGIFMPGEGDITVRIESRDGGEGIQGYRLTTSRWLNGAIAIFYPYVKEQLAWMMQGDFYVGFPSIHEAVIHPVRYKVLSEMKAAIHHTNIIFDEREMLTNRVYRYMSNRQELLEV